MSEREHEDRFLIQRGQRWHYLRRVPGKYAHVDRRGKIRRALDTDKKSIARLRRDEHEAADDLYWQSLVRGDPDTADIRYQAALRRAKALNVDYQTAEALAAGAPLEDLLRRAELLGDSKPTRTDTDAVLGGAAPANVKISEAFTIFLEQIAPDRLRGKSDHQKRKWTTNKRRSVNRFVEVAGDLAMDDITREHALTFYRWWQARLTPGQGNDPVPTFWSGKREVGDLRKLYEDYYTWFGSEDRANPFRKLAFKRTERPPRPPFPVDWIVEHILAHDALDGLNLEARLIVYVLIESGARPSEVANLDQAVIHTQVNAPYITIRPTETREIKTGSSARNIPLIGIGLEAMRLAPEGFPRYRDKPDVLSATLNKYFKENGLLPTPKHSIYCFRHTFEDRMKEAGIDYELRCELMGHAIDRPDYGEGGSMAFKLEQIEKIALPYPDGLLDGLQNHRTEIG